MKLIEGQFINTRKGRGRIEKLIPTAFGYQYRIKLANGTFVHCLESDIVKDTTK